MDTDKLIQAGTETEAIEMDKITEKILSRLEQRLILLRLLIKTGEGNAWKEN